MPGGGVYDHRPAPLPTPPTAQTPREYRSQQEPAGLIWTYLDHIKQYGLFRPISMSAKDRSSNCFP